MNRYLGLALAFAVGLASPRAQTARCENLTAMTCEQRLTLDRCIPFGSDLDSTKAIGFRIFGNGSYGWTNVFGYPIRLVIDSDAGGVARIAYTASLSDAGADSLYGLLEEFYTSHNGVATTIVTNEDYVRGKRWSGETCDIGLISVSGDGMKHQVYWTLLPSGALTAALKKNRE
jgi:hypothetical protein